MELLRSMVEKQFAVHTARLTQLTVYARLPRREGYAPRTLDVLAASSRQRISPSPRPAPARTPQTPFTLRARARSTTRPRETASDSTVGTSDDFSNFAALRWLAVVAAR